MKRWLVIGLALLGGVGLWLGGPHLLRRVAIFRVRRIEVTGARYLGAPEVARGLGLGAGASLFDPRAPLERRVLAMPGIQRAEVRRRLLGALEVRVTEFEPVALTPTPGAGRLALLDRRGRVLPFDPTRLPVDLPIVPPDSAVTGLMDRVRDTDPRLFADIVSASRDHHTIVLETVNRRILFRVGASPKEIQGVGLVTDEIERRHLESDLLDARWEGRVVIRRTGWGRGATRG